MIKSIKQWTLPKDKCIDCHKKIFCSHISEKICKWGIHESEYDLTKPGILIIDDNEGICSFMEDDLEELDLNGRINLDDYNVFTFYDKMCAYDLLGTLSRMDLNIKKAIIDITYGGTVISEAGNIKLNGVDVFEVLYEMHPDLKYVFYTGNQMNYNIKVIGQAMRKYTKITGKKITDNILFKTQLSMDGRRDFFMKTIFNELEMSKKSNISDIVGDIDDLDDIFEEIKNP